MTTVIWNNYTLELRCVRGQWVATCQRSGHTYRRFDRNVWLNDLHNRVDDDLCAALEAGVREHQSRADSASVRRIDSLYTRDGRRVSLATGRRVVQRKQPRGTWRRGDDERGA